MSQATGPRSTSFHFSAVGLLSGLGLLVTNYFQNSGGEATTVRALVGGALALGSIAAKLWHDGVFNKAAIQNAGSELAAQLPTLRADLATSVAFVQNDLPAVRAAISGLQGQVATIEGKVPDLASIESIVRTALADILAKTTPLP